MEIYDIAEVSRHHARDDRYGPLLTYDGRKVYMPDVGQKEQPLPKSWGEEPTELLTQEVT